VFTAKHLTSRFVSLPSTQVSSAVDPNSWSELVAWSDHWSGYLMFNIPHPFPFPEVGHCHHDQARSLFD